MVNVILAVVSVGMATCLIKYFEQAESIMAIASVMNLALIILFYYRDSKERKSELIIQRKAHWFRDILLEKHITLINEFFNRCEDIASDYQTLLRDNIQCKEEYESRSKDLFGAYTDAKRTVSSNFINVVSSFDQLFANNLNDLLAKFQDDFTHKLALMLISPDDFPDAVLLVELVGEQKRELLNSLYNFEQGGYRLPAKEKKPNFSVVDNFKAKLSQ